MADQYVNSQTGEITTPDDPNAQLAGSHASQNASLPPGGATVDSFQTPSKDSGAMDTSAVAYDPNTLSPVDPSTPGAVDANGQPINIVKQEPVPTGPSTMDKLSASPIGRAASHAGEIANAVANPAGAISNAVTPLVKKVGNWATGGAFENELGQNQPSALPQDVKKPSLTTVATKKESPAPVAQLHPHQQKALQQIDDSKYVDEHGIDTQALMNDKAILSLDDQQRANIKQKLDDTNAHIKTMKALGAKAAKDASGDAYWSDANAGLKILRVLGGIVTLGGSEKFINAQIAKNVAQDQAAIGQEGNIYNTMLEMGKTREEALSADYAKQAHIYTLGLDQIAARSKSPVLHDHIAAVKAGMQKDTSLALANYYKQQQENAVAKQNANTSSFNAQTERMKAMADVGKVGQANNVRDINGNITGRTDTPEQAKQIQAQQLSVAGLDALGKKIKSYSWADKFTPTARATAAADYSQAMQLVNSYRAAHPNEESSRQMEVLQKSIPNPSDFTTSPNAYRSGYNELLKQMRSSLVDAKKTSGI